MPETLEKLRSELMNELHRLRNIVEDKLDKRERQILDEVEKRMNEKVSEYLKKDDAYKIYVPHKDFSKFMTQFKWIFGFAFIVISSLLGIMWTTIEKNAEVQVEYYTEVRSELSELNGRLEPFDFSITD